MNFRDYITESLTDDLIYRFYTLNYIISAGNRLTFEDWEMEEVSAKYRNVRYKLWEEMCSDSIRIILGEARHISKHAGIPEGKTFPGNKMQPFKFSHNIMIFNGRSIESFDDVRKSIKEIFGMSVLEVLEHAELYFRELDWERAFGGEGWADITRAVIEFYKSRSEVNAEEIDQILNMAHNTGEFLSKFPQHSTLKRALDIKMNAPTPHSYKDKIEDPKIKKWLGMALIGTDKPKAPIVMDIKFPSKTSRRFRSIDYSTSFVQYKYRCEMKFESSGKYSPASLPILNYPVIYLHFRWSKEEDIGGISFKYDVLVPNFKKNTLPSNMSTKTLKTRERVHPNDYIKKKIDEGEFLTVLNEMAVDSLENSRHDIQKHFEDFYQKKLNGLGYENKEVRVNLLPEKYDEVPTILQSKLNPKITIGIENLLTPV